MRLSSSSLRQRTATAPPPRDASARPLGLFFVVMLMFGITTTLHGLSPLATYGLGAVFFLLLAVVGFLLPASMIAVELATGWDRDGGVFLWASEAFGKNAGFFATWLQWFQDVIFWTVILTGSAAMLALGIGWSEGAENKVYIVAVVLGSIWFTTAMTGMGLRSSGWVGTVGSLVGTIVPGIALVAFAVIYLSEGHPSNISFDVSALVPDLSKAGNLTFAISTILIFAGIELMGTRVGEIRNPGHTYPRATWVAIGMTTILLVPTVLAIAVLVPRGELNIAAGIVQAIATAFDSVWHIKWVPALFAIALLIDSIGEIAGWMSGTPIAMATAAREGFLPKRFGRETRGAVPSMLLGQAIVGSLISVLFIAVPTVRSVFWLLSALLVQLYLLMYILLFASAWRLRFTQPNRPRAWRVPGGKVGIAIVSLVGIAFAAAAFVVGFIPPSSLTELTTAHYLGVLCSALAVSLGIPLLLMVWRNITP
jgi:glutamate:GABA antiporter